MYRTPQPPRRPPLGSGRLVTLGAAVLSAHARLILCGSSLFYSHETGGSSAASRAPRGAVFTASLYYSSHHREEGTRCHVSRNLLQYRYMEHKTASFQGMTVETASGCDLCCKNPLSTHPVSGCPSMSLATHLAASGRRSRRTSLNSEMLVIPDLAGVRAVMATVQHVAVSAK